MQKIQLRKNRTAYIDVESDSVYAYEDATKSSRIGSLEFTRHEPPGFSEEDYFKLTYSFLNEIDGFTGLGLGSECVKAFLEENGGVILVMRDDGNKRDDGSHPIESGAIFHESLVKKGLARYTN